VTIRRLTSSARSWALGAALAAAFVLPGCSALIDVDPDCDQVSTCAPYTCNAENTACLFACDSDSECASGFVCQTDTGACISTGCAPTTDPVELLTLEGSGFEYDVGGYLDSYWALLASSARVGIVRVDRAGTIVQGADEPILLEESPALPALPIVVGAEDSVSMFWRGQERDDSLRFFRIYRDGDNPQRTAGPRVLYTAEVGRNIDAPAATRVGDELLVAWTSFLDRTRVQLLALNADGTWGPDRANQAPSDAPAVLTEGLVGSATPALAAVGELGAVARRDTRAGENEIVAGFLDADNELSVEHTASEVRTDSMERLQVAGLDSGELGLVWLESRQDGRRLQRAVVNEEGVVLRATDTRGETTNPVDATISRESRGFAIAWVASEGEREGVFLRRFDAAGQPLFTPITVDTGGDLSRPRVVSSGANLGVFWVDSSGSSPALQYRGYRCE
jgi:hypothetical protein